MLKQMGINISGIEPSNYYFRFAKRNNLPVEQLFLEEKSGTFDVVSLFDVLEHINDTKNLIVNINRVLQRGGYLILRVPNTLYAKIKIFVHRIISYPKFPVLDPPIHIFYLSSYSINILFPEDKYSLIHSYPSISLKEKGFIGFIRYLLQRILLLDKYLNFGIAIDQVYILKKL